MKSLLSPDIPGNPSGRAGSDPGLTPTDCPYGLGKDGPGGWWILTEPEVPDAAYATLAPDWVLVGSDAGNEVVRVGPFDEIGLELTRL